jgi:LemA protein
MLLAAAFCVLWLLHMRRNLAALDENAGNAMNQIGVQLSARFDVLILLLEAAKAYSSPEDGAWAEALKSRRAFIGADAAPAAARQQEEAIAEGLAFLEQLSTRAPALKDDPSYASCMQAMERFEKMIATGRLIYNDSAARLNRELRRFPVSLAAEPMGFRQRAYWEESEETETLL